MTSSVVLPVITFLKKEMIVSEDDPGYVRSFKEAFVVDLTNRSGQLYDNGHLSLATVLDIRFKSLKCLPKNKREPTWSLLRNLAQEELVEPTKKSRRMQSKFNCELSSSDSDDADSVAAADPVLMEINMYRSLPCESDMSADPLNFWKVNHCTYPCLSKVARQCLGIPASSVPVERVFSIAGEIISKRRSCLSADTANMLLSLHY